MILARTSSRPAFSWAMSLRTSCPAAADIALRTFRTSLKLLIVDSLFQEFQGRNEHRAAYTEHCIDAANVPELVGICEMLAVPRYQKITPVIRRSGKVQRVASGISGHQSVGNVGIDDLGNRFVKIDEGEAADQGHRFLP
jgi:hypothetical protein